MRRKGILVIGCLLFVAFIALLCITKFLPYKIVRDTVNEIPAIQAYFVEHKDELEKERHEFGEDKKFFSTHYDRYSKGFFEVRFCYNAFGAESTGYKDILQTG